MTSPVDLFEHWIRTRFVDLNTELEEAYHAAGTDLPPDRADPAGHKESILFGGARLGRLEVERHFEVKGTASGDGALYASGATTLGGYFPGVDTFLGLQIAAQEIADDLARRGWCRRIGPVRSTTQWLRWLFDRPVEE